MLDGMAGFVSEQSKTLGLRSTLDFEDLGTFESPKARMNEVEGDRDSRYARWREPFLRKPTMRADAQALRSEFLMQSLDWPLEPGFAKRDAEIAEAPFEQFPCRSVLPGMSGWHEEDSIPREWSAREKIGSPAVREAVIF